MPFNVALGGLRASSTDLEVTGNNIANASTVGFKRSRAEFGDVYSNSFFGRGATSTGDGVAVQNIRQMFGQGNVSFTDNNLDLAITGNGFFVLSDQGEAKYSRAGQLGVDKDGFMVNNTGMRVQGFQADEGGTVSGVLGDLVVDANDLPPSRSTNVEAALNLDSSEEALTQSGTTINSNGATDVGVAQAGIVNGYASQDIEVTFPDGTSQTITTTAESTAGAIASQFSLLEGVDATASTSSTITLAGYDNASGNMSISLNGISFQPAGATDALQLADLGTRINSSALVGVTAVIDSATGDLQIIQDQGANLVFGFAGVSGDSFEVLGSDAAATPVVLDPDAVPAVLNATVGGGVSIVLDEGVVATNLSATTPVITNFTGAPFVNNQFSPTDPGTYNHATSTTIFDSLGNSHVLTMYFVKQQSSLSGENTWQMHVQVDNQDVGDPLIGTDASRATYNLVFRDDGTLNETLSDDVLISNWDPLDSQGNQNGAARPLNVVDGGVLPIPQPPTSSNFEVDVSSFTQFGSPFAVNDLSQNGYTTGRLVGLDVDESGVILSRFSNGESLVLGQAALANFNDVEGLSPDGDSVWVQTFASGDPIVGAPGTASLGLLTASAVEQSNVDLSAELVNLIVAQRNYQANSKTIETADTIQQTILNI
ncbi:MULTISPECIES: flagellar hook-basal body complex protein [unclassified Oleiphilus]|uniref:flagellar hook-basal body complex protein n=5 Tax=Oleiphilus TaxID=141450 RepID=UPI0007C27264|nr:MULTISPECIES: flagellar hook-basal body complex protein [unclassified Oleiphilus]KZY58978.1 flagellar biosynthesis protein FlgE [Oleiphilus sp. HI0061]KZZ36530.1 flagellar biosynthesis protein FlgE [Oleiphilus sp. HI0086]KZZ37661.1 flagellar biosynthesis protein FlgE [Oleiphilus sp. HI0117]KZZ53478.1 flagellar biosynthesis protein FlgE [Oleiphilus sp. HI0123]